MDAWIEQCSENWHVKLLSGFVAVAVAIAGVLDFAEKVKVPTARTCHASGLGDGCGEYRVGNALADPRFAHAFSIPRFT